MLFDKKIRAWKFKFKVHKMIIQEYIIFNIVENIKSHQGK